jgi:hypothetical protein
MITAAFAFLLVAPRAETITYHGPVDRLEVVLADLSKQTGENLQPGVGLGDLPVFLRCDDRPTAEVYKQLASLVNGRWERDSRAYRLIRDPRDIARERREDQEEFAHVIGKSLAKKRAEVEKLGPFDEAQATSLVKQLMAMNKEIDPNRNDSSIDARLSASARQSPTSRALTRILTQIDPVLLASLPVGIKVVCSSRPNARQYPLPTGTEPIIERAIQDQKLFFKAAARYALRPVESDGGTYFYTPLVERLDSENKTDRVWLSLYNRPGTILQAEFRLLDEKGTSITRDTDYISVNSMDELGNDLFESIPKTDYNEFIQFDSTRKSMIDAFAIKVEPGKAPTESSALPPFAREMALNIDQDEPTKYFVTDLMQQALPPGPVAAIVDDKMIYLTLIKRQRLPLESAMKGIRTFGLATTDNGWTQFRPRMMGEFMSGRLSRKVQAQIIRDSAATDTFTIDHQAMVAYLYGDNEVDFLTMMFVARLRNELNPSLVNIGGLGRLYGSLTSTQRRAAAIDGISVSNLQKSQLDILDKIVFGQYVNLTFDPSEASSDPEKSGEAIDFSSFSEGIAGEPTEILPNGYTKGVTIKTSEINDIIAMPESVAGSNHFYGEETAEEYAAQQYHRTRPEIFTWINPKENQPTKFKCAKRRQINVTITLKPGIKIMDSLAENRMLVSTPVAYGGLPAEFRAKVTETLAKLKEQYKDAKAGMYGSAGSGSRIPPN